jgi:hypothetical protein
MPTLVSDRVQHFSKNMDARRNCAKTGTCHFTLRSWLQPIVFELVLALVACSLSISQTLLWSWDNWDCATMIPYLIFDEASIFWWREETRVGLGTQLGVPGPTTPNYETGNISKDLSYSLHLSYRGRGQSVFWHEVPPDLTQHRGKHRLTTCTTVHTAPLEFKAGSINQSINLLLVLLYI